MKSFFKECCSDAWLDLIESSKQNVSILKNEVVFRSGEKAKGIFEIVKGKVKVTANDKLDNEVLLRLAGNNSILGHRGIGGDWKYHVTATALEDTTLVFIPRSTFEILAQTNPKFSYKLLTLFAEDLRYSEEKFLHLPVVNRIANAILLNYRAFGMNQKTKQLNYTLSRQDMANAAITTYESTVRAIAELKNKKIIGINKKSIIINDLKALEQFGTK